MSENELPREVQREIIEKGGYVPVTPLGPPPQGEPLFSKYPSQPPNQPQSGTTPPAAPPQASSQQQAP